jgi:RNA polymerase sigma-70 factor, ECF subfamily
MRKNPDPAFASLLHAQQESLLRAARLLTGDWTTAEDLLQDTFAWALRTWRSLAHSGTAPVQVRQQLVARYLATADPGRQAVPLVRRGLSFGAALEQLSAKDRAMVVARYYLDLSAAEIAEVLDLDAEDVDASAVRLLATLRESIEVGGD